MFMWTKAKYSMFMACFTSKMSDAGSASVCWWEGGRYVGRERMSAAAVKLLHTHTATHTNTQATLCGHTSVSVARCPVEVSNSNSNSNTSNTNSAAGAFANN